MSVRSTAACVVSCAVSRHSSVIHVCMAYSGYCSEEDDFWICYAHRGEVIFCRGFTPFFSLFGAVSRTHPTKAKRVLGKSGSTLFISSATVERPIRLDLKDLKLTEPQLLEWPTIAYLQGEDLTFQAAICSPMQHLLCSHSYLYFKIQSILWLSIYKIDKRT